MWPVFSSAARCAFSETKCASRASLHLAGFKSVGLQHGGVELVVQFFEHGDQALLVNRFFLGCQRAAFAQRFEHVVHARERQACVRGLLTLAVCVDLFGQRAYAFAQFGREAGVVVGKGKVSKQRI